MLIVQKYGGSSLKDAERLRHVAGLVRDRRGEAELVVVVSAMGGTTDRLTGQAREMSPEPSARELDALVTTGEQQSAALLVMTMEELGLPAVSLTGWQAGIMTDKNYGDGDIRLISLISGQTECAVIDTTVIELLHEIILLIKWSIIE